MLQLGPRLQKYIGYDTKSCFSVDTCSTVRRIYRRAMVGDTKWDTEYKNALLGPLPRRREELRLVVLQELRFNGRN